VQNGREEAARQKMNGNVKGEQKIRYCKNVGFTLTFWHRVIHQYRIPGVVDYSAVVVEREFEKPQVFPKRVILHHEHLFVRVFAPEDERVRTLRVLMGGMSA